MKAFNNRPAYFRIIISSEIRNYIFKYIYGHEIELYTTRQTGKRDKRQ